MKPCTEKVFQNILVTRLSNEASDGQTGKGEIDYGGQGNYILIVDLPPGTADAPLLGQLPIDPALTKLCDEGNIERYNDEIVDQLGRALAQMMSPKVM